LQALTDLDVSGCGGAGDAFLLQLLGGRFWDVKDCLPVHRLSTQNRAVGAQCSPLEALGVAGADFLEACAPAALAMHSDGDARGIVLLEQALQVMKLNGARAFAREFADTLRRKQKKQQAHPLRPIHLFSRALIPRYRYCHQ
jgi:hypothetical protein